MLLISQIVGLQCFHYLCLALLLPPILSTFASPSQLAYEGGATSVSIIMDWREFVGAPTVSLPAEGRSAHGGWITLSRASGVGPDEAGTARTQVSVHEVAEGLLRIVESDSARGWATAVCWMLASFMDVFYLYHLIQRPTHILDFALTLMFNHIILTTYYSAHFPASFFFWLVVSVSAIAQIVLAEHWCVQRDLKEGFSLDTSSGAPTTSGSTAPPSRRPSPLDQHAMEMGAVKEPLLSGANNGEYSPEQTLSTSNAGVRSWATRSVGGASSSRGQSPSPMVHGRRGSDGSLTSRPPSRTGAASPMAGAPAHHTRAQSGLR